MRISKNHLLIKKGNNINDNIFFIHAGNGEIQNYIKLCSLISGDKTCWGIRANRFYDYTPNNESIESMCYRYLNTICSIQPKGPYRIIGWCFGGIRAYEIAKQIEQMGENVSFLGIINSHVPISDEIEREKMITQYAMIDYNISQESFFDITSEEKIIKKWLKTAQLSWDSIPKNSSTIWDEFLKRFKNDRCNNELIRTIKEMLPEDRKKAIPYFDNITLEKLIYYLAVMRTDARAQAYYFPNKKINTPLYYFSAKDSPVLDKEKWSSFTERDSVFIDIKGDHFSIFNENIMDLSKAINQIMS